MAPFVDEVLREWEFIAFFAYDGFESYGRGVVALELEPEGTRATYGPREFFRVNGHTDILRLIDEYDPAHEFVVYFDEPGGTRGRGSARPRTAGIPSAFGFSNSCGA